MERHFVQELDALKSNLITMGTLVEQAIRDSNRAFLERRSDLAQEVLNREEEVNSFEMSIRSSWEMPSCVGLIHK